MSVSNQQNRRWSIFLVVAVGVFMSTMDSSMVNIALSSIMREFNSPLRETEWVVMIYLLTITATLLFWGHLSDRLGRRRMYSLGMFIFAGGSLACSYSPRLGWLVFSRLIQAVGAAMMMSTGPAIIKETSPPDQLGRSLGMIGVAVSLGLMTGPLISGFLIEYYSWRSIFIITVPVGLLFGLLAGKVIPVSKKQSLVPHKLNWRGTICWTITVTLFSVAVSHATAPAWSTLRILIILAAAIVALSIFVRMELKAVHPLLPLHFFKKWFFSSAIVSSILSFTLLFSAIILTPFYLDRILGLPSSNVGLIMMAIPLSAIVIAPCAGWMSDIFGAKLLSTSGLLVSTSSLFLLAGLTPETRPIHVGYMLALLGCGQAMFLSPNSASVLARVIKEHTGASAAMLATARNLGMLLGIAQSALVFSYYFSELTGGLDMKDVTGDNVVQFMTALKYAFLAAAATGLLAALVSWLRERDDEGGGDQQK